MLHYAPRRSPARRRILVGGDVSWRTFEPFQSDRSSRRTRGAKGSPGDGARKGASKRLSPKDTPLAGKLVRHVGRYKTLIDTLRVALANIESDLAMQLAPALPRATEAKKTLANLFAAPGLVTLGKRTITVALAPAATKPEREAFATLLRYVNAQRLTLPGDRERRELRFQLQQF